MIDKKWRKLKKIVALILYHWKGHLVYFQVKMLVYEVYEQSVNQALKNIFQHFLSFRIRNQEFSAVCIFSFQQYMVFDGHSNGKAFIPV